MAVLNIPDSFSPNTVALSGFINANFTAIKNWSTTIDASNLAGGTGIWASQIVPLTAAEATFGLTATGVGYKFLANDATATPLTVSGVSGQSADVFDVTLTSGGTKAFAITSSGSGSFSGAVSFGSSGTTIIGNTIQTQSNPIIAAELFCSNTTSPTNPTIAGLANGAIITQLNGSSGLVAFGGSTKSAEISYNNNISNGFEFKDTVNTWTPFSAGTYTNASDISLKTSVAPISGALALVSQLKPSSFVWVADSRNDIGFVAQDIAAIFPDAVTTFPDGTLGYAPVAILAHLVAAFQEYVATHP